ncbi:MAG TPA: hypothetical protein VII70_01685 [Steroidobacteraceae bacterium]
MALHQSIQRLLLLGVRIPAVPAPPAAQPPSQLLPLIESIAKAHRVFDERAVYYGHRYRSGYWAIYMLSAIAVLFAVLPLALGWDDNRHVLHPFVGLWALGEVAVIFSVGAIYWQGHRHDWQGQWLGARTTAELSWYLPLIAPLVDFTRHHSQANWYMRVLDPGQQLHGGDAIAALCSANEPLARRLLEHAGADRQFEAAYAHWTMGILEEQKHYHQRVAIRQHALLHRVHRVNIWLFGLTGVGALMHLAVHTLWLSIVTTFFPALGASLHGALAQSEAYRLSATSQRLVGELQGAIDKIRAAADAKTLKASIEAAIALVLEEHQDWHMLVRPHHLPLG